MGVFYRYPQQQENTWIIVIIVLCEEDIKKNSRKKNILEKYFSVKLGYGMEGRNAVIR